MKREPIKSVPSLYVRLLPEILEIARQCGYAIGTHGSMTHDIDLIAVPWVHNALPGAVLVERIREYVGGYIQTSKDEAIIAPSPERKVHGRIGWSIYFNRRFTGPYIDISVTPRVDWETKKLIED